MGDRTVDATIEDTRPETVGQEKKLVLYMVGFKKGLVLNATNNKRLQKAFGKETDDWKEKNIQLYTTLVSYKEEEVSAIRIKIPDHPDTKAPAEPAAQPAEEPQSGASAIDEVFGAPVKKGESG